MHLRIRRAGFDIMAMMMVVAMAPSNAAGQAVPVYDVRAFGATGDGVTKDTSSFEKALAACAASPIGGEVQVPAGKYLIGSIVLPSRTTLRVMKDALIQGTDDFNDYPLKKCRWEGLEVPAHRALISARNAEHIAIIGKGTIRGNSVMKPKLNPHRPMLIEMMNCTNIVFADLRLENFNTWCLHPVYCTDILATNLHFVTQGINSDGFDPDSCQRVRIGNCRFDTGDDCIAIKSGIGKEGARIGKPSEDITIRNCHFVRGLGGVALGSECSGGIRRVTVENCIFEKGVKWAALYLKSRPGRGAFLENFTARDIASSASRTIWIDFNYNYTPDQQGIEGAAGLTRTGGIRIERLKINGGTLMEAIGHFEKPIDGFYLGDIQGTCNKGVRLTNARNVELKNIGVTGFEGPLLQITEVQGVGLEIAAPDSN
jgi:polygalacturonase